MSSLESSTVPIPEPRPLKRSASTASSVASLPTPPRTARKTRRSSNHNPRSKGRTAARPKHHRSHEEDSTDVEEQDDPKDSLSRKRQKTSTMESVPERPEDEDVFWLSGGGADSATQQTATEESPPTTTSTRYRSETDQRSVHSLVSPPPSKRQVQAPVTPSRSAQSSLITPRRSGRLSSRSRTIDSDVEDSPAGPVRDSPDNPFLDSDDKAPASPDTPTPAQQGEKPTILYVLCVFFLVLVIAPFLMCILLWLAVASGVPLRTHTTTLMGTKRTRALYSQSNIQISHRARFASPPFSSKLSERSGWRQRSIQSLLEAVTSGRGRKNGQCRQILAIPRTSTNRRASCPSP
jgi:hypothetical protein